MHWLTFAHASMWCCSMGTPATGNKGLGTSNDSGLNLVPWKNKSINIGDYQPICNAHHLARCSRLKFLFKLFLLPVHEPENELTEKQVLNKALGAGDLATYNPCVSHLIFKTGLCSLTVFIAICRGSPVKNYWRSLHIVLLCICYH